MAVGLRALDSLAGGTSTRRVNQPSHKYDTIHTQPMVRYFIHPILNNKSMEETLSHLIVGFPPSPLAFLAFGARSLATLAHSPPSQNKCRRSQNKAAATIRSRRSHWRHIYQSQSIDPFDRPIAESCLPLPPPAVSIDLDRSSSLPSPPAASPPRRCASSASLTPTPGFTGAGIRACVPCCV